jgi:putative alpha-1,2-mannosidase
LPASPHAHINLSLGKDAELSVVGPNTLQGSQRITCTVATVVDLTKETRLYFYAEFSRPFGSYQTWQNHTLQHEGSVRGDEIGFVSTQSTFAGAQIEVRVGLSYISADQAKRNLLFDAGGKSFEAVKAATRAQWGRRSQQSEDHRRNGTAAHYFLYGSLAVPLPYDGYRRRWPLLLRIRSCCSQHGRT